MVALLTQCCCGCSLRSGTIIIGVLAVIGGLYYIAAYSMGLSVIDSGVLDQTLDLIKKKQNEMHSEIEYGNVDKERQDEMLNNAKHVVTTVKDLKWYIILSLIVRSIEFILSIVMLVGTLTERPKLLLPWIICEVTIGILVAIEYVVVGIQYAIGDLGWLATGYFAGLLVGTLISAYLIYVVYSHYKTMSKDNYPFAYVSSSEKPN